MRAWLRRPVVGVVGGLVLGAALSACGTSPDSPLVQVTPSAPTTNDTLRVQLAPVPGITYATVWYRNGEEVPDVAAEVPARLTARGETWRVVVTPSDDAGKTYDPTEVSVTVVNSVPHGAVMLSPSSPLTGQDLTAVTGFIDDDGDEIRYRYTWKRNGADAGISDAVVPGAKLVKGDVWEVTVVAEDDEGEVTAVGTATVANSLPTLAGARILPENARGGTPLSCEGIGYADADGDPPGFRARWLIDDIEVGNELTLGADQVLRGTRVQCLLSPFDGEGEGQVSATRVLEVGNAPPMMTSVAIANSPPTRDEPLRFDPRGIVDPDGDDISYQVWWVVNGRGVSTQPELSTALFRRGDTVQVRVTPTDGTDAGIEYRSAELEVANAKPKVTASTFNVTPLYSDSMLIPNVAFSDADNDEVSLTWAWSVNGAPVGDDSGTLSGLDHFDRGDTVSYTIVPNDGIEDGATFTSSTESVVNKAPSTPVMGLGPRPLVSTSDLECQLLTPSVDADGDPITYIFDWDLNGKVYAGLTDETTYAGDTIPYAQLTVGQQWTCTVSTSDGTDDANVVEETSTIRPSILYYTVEKNTDLVRRTSSCSLSGKTGYQGSASTTTGVGWTFNDTYGTKPKSLTLEWRRGTTTDSTTTRTVWLNGTNIGTATGFSYTTSCDSAVLMSFTSTSSAIAGAWVIGGANVIELRSATSSGTEGVFPDDTLKLGRLRVNE